MIIFTLLLLTISGIHASVRLEGDQHEYSFSERDSKFNYLGTIFGCGSRYHYNTFNITRDLGYTSWDRFLEDYKYIDFDDKIHIEFSRHDKKGKTFDVQVSPKRIDLRKIRLSDSAPMWEGKELVFYNVGVGGDVTQAMVLPGAEYAFKDYREELFDETIWVKLARINAEVHVSAEGYTRNGQLLLAVVYRFKCSQWFSRSGLDFKMTGHNAMIFEA